MSATGASVRTSGTSSQRVSWGALLGWFNRVFRMLVALVLCVGLGLLAYRSYQYFSSPQNFPVNSAVVEGRFQYLDRAVAQDIVAQHARRGFFGMDADTLQAQIIALAWVEDARVQRVWPSGVVLTVYEHKPVARWNEQQLLTQLGAVIAPPQLQVDATDGNAWQTHFAALPFLRSASGRPAVVWTRFVQAQKALRGEGVALRGLFSDERHSIDLQLSSGAQVRLGRGWFDERLSRFVGVYARYIAPQVERIAYVDLRYPNGFAIGHNGVSGS